MIQPDPCAQPSPVDSITVTRVDGTSRRYLLATSEREAAAELLAALLAVRDLRGRPIATAPIRETNALVDAAIARAKGRPS